MNGPIPRMLVTQMSAINSRRHAVFQPKGKFKHTLKEARRTQTTVAGLGPDPSKKINGVSGRRDCNARAHRMEIVCAQHLINNNGTLIRLDEECAQHVVCGINNVASLLLFETTAANNIN